MYDKEALAMLKQACLKRFFYLEDLFDLEHRERIEMRVKFFKEKERRGFQQLGDHVLCREKIPEKFKLTGGPRVVRVVVSSNLS